MLPAERTSSYVQLFIETVGESVGGTEQSQKEPVRFDLELMAAFGSNRPGRLGPGKETVK